MNYARLHQGMISNHVSISLGLNIKTAESNLIYNVFSIYDWR